VVIIFALGILFYGIALLSTPEAEHFLTFNFFGAGRVCVEIVFPVVG
jgi:hypothetical protein